MLTAELKTPPTKLMIYTFTNPFCIWCWASEPMLRKIEVEFGEHVEIYPYIGSLIPDLRVIQDPESGLYAYDIERSNKNFIERWQRHASEIGMPIDVVGLELFNERRYSTMPTEVALEAARLANETLFPMYLRRIREALFTEQVPVNEQDEYLRLAEEVGYDLDSFTEPLINGRARSYFYEGLQTAEKYGVDTYPTSILVWQDDEREEAIFLKSFVTFSAYADAIDKLSHGQTKAHPLPPTVQSVHELSKRYSCLATREIAEILNLEDSEAETLALEAGLKRKAIHTSAFFYR